MEIKILVKEHQKSDLENFTKECEKQGFKITREGGGNLPNFSGYYAELKGERWQKVDTRESNCTIDIVSNSLPDRFWFEDEHGHKVTVIGYFKEWCLVEDIHNEEPYCLPLGYVQTMYDEMVAEGNEC